MNRTHDLPDNVDAGSDACRAARLKQLLAHQGKPRTFLTELPIRNAHRHRVTGIELTVRLTSYRSLPLSCIAGIRLSINGAAIDTDGSILVLQGVEHRLNTFPDLSAIWWFILDSAALFVPLPNPLAAGIHTVEATLATVEPYMTAGRFTFFSTSKRQLRVDAPLIGAEG